MLDIVKYLLVFVEVVCSALLLGVILIQKTRSQGMGLAFGAGMGESLFGAQMGNVLTKATVILAIVFLSNTIVLAWLGARGSVRASVTESVEAEPLPATSSGVPGGMPAAVPDVPGAGVPAAPDLPDVPETPVPLVEGQPGAVESVPAVPDVAPPANVPAPPMPDVAVPPVDVAPAPPDAPPPEPAPAPEKKEGE